MIGSPRAGAAGDTGASLLPRCRPSGHPAPELVDPIKQAVAGLSEAAAAAAAGPMDIMAIVSFNRVWGHPGRPWIPMHPGGGHRQWRR